VCGATLFFTDLVVMSGDRSAAKVLRLLREPHHVRWVNRTFGGLFGRRGPRDVSPRRLSPVRG
jgi:homoserine/homoserine lactone efflux protein